MKKINVFLRIGKRPHPNYYSYLDMPPEGINYKYEEIIRGDNKKAGILHELKVKLWLWSLKHRPPIIKIDPRGCDLIHSMNNVMNSGKTPWVMDVEHLEGLFGMNRANVKRKLYFYQVKRILTSKYCKKLMPHTIAAKLSILNAGLKELEPKMEVVYPGKESVPNFKKKPNKTPIILWMGRRFLEKGGKTVLHVFDKLDGKAEFKLIMKGPVPEEIKRKYVGKKNIEFSDTEDYVSSNWRDFYKKADIVLYPTNFDSLGNVYFDAMNYKAPIVTGDIFNSSEVVEDGVNGFVVNHPFKWHDENFQPLYDAGEYIPKLKNFYDEKFVSDLAKKVIVLIKNPTLRLKMGEAGYKLISEGKFSIKERNKKLRKIYEEAIKK